MRLPIAVLALLTFVVLASVELSATPAYGQLGGVVSGISESPQAPARDVRKPRTGTGRITGRVLNAETSGPVRRAVVRISPVGGDPISQPAVTTDADGNFQFANLPSGTYQLFASKSGYLMTRYGAEAGDDSLGKTIKLGEGEAATGTTILMPRGGAIGGRVLDEFGEPTANVFVQVWRRQSVRGVKRLQAAGASIGGTDDLGHYRVFGLEPGTYYVSAMPRNDMGPNIESADRSGYAPSFYPGTPSAGDAQPVVVASGQDVSGVDFVLSVARLARVSGVVTSAAGTPVRNAYVAASSYSPDGAFSSASGGQVQPDGTFTINNLAPGDYVLTVRIAGPAAARVAGATGPSPAQMEMGMVRVNVSGSDITGLVVQTSTGSTLTGQLVYEGAAKPPQSGPNVFVNAVGADPFDPVNNFTSGGGGPVQPDGSFTLRGLFGDRILRVGAPSGWMLKAIYAGGRDVTDSPISFDGRSQVSDVEVVLTDRVTHVSGVVSDERGQPVDGAYVFIASTDAAKAAAVASRHVRTVVARQGNSWKADGLPPGEYVAVALKSTRGLDTQDPEFLDSMRKTGTRFTVREGETREVSLKIAPSPG